MSLFHATYLCSDYTYLELHYCFFTGLFTVFYLLTALVYFSCILIGQFCFQFFIFIPKFHVSHFRSDIFSPCLQLWKIGFVQTATVW